MRDADKARGKLALPFRRAFLLSYAGEVLLVSSTLLAELTHDLLPEPRGLGKHLIEPVEHLFEAFGVDRGTVGHSRRKDYVITFAA